MFYPAYQDDLSGVSGCFVPRIRKKSSPALPYEGGPGSYQELPVSFLLIQ